MDVMTHVKSIATIFVLPKTVYLLYYYNLCNLDAAHIITYLLIFPTNKISEGQFLVESFVEAL